MKGQVAACLLLLSLAHGVWSGCPEVCTLEYAPVCGSNGRTYNNECFLEYASCKSEVAITKKHDGMCDLFLAKRQTDECPSYAHQHICTLEYAPVCASNGKTYPNLCQMCAYMYEQQEEGHNIVLTVDYHGVCKTAYKKADFCTTRDTTGICTREYDPICGTDGKTYGNQCTFCYEQYQKEQNGEELTVDHFGECHVVQRRSVDEVKCLERYNTGVCTREYFPICGSDGKTYGNKCTYCYAKSQNGGDLTVDHFGVCAAIEKRSVDEVQCLERYNTGVCTREYFPICGSDGKTYGNKCTYCFAKHQKQQNGEELTFKHFGACAVIEKRSADIDCPVRYNTGACTREYFPICGSDGKTYGNKCTFCYAKSQNGGDLSVDHIGTCKPKDNCPESSKHGICTLEYAPVCANNGQTYSNECAMCADMYRRQQQGENVHIHVEHTGVC